MLPLLLLSCPPMQMHKPAANNSNSPINKTIRSFNLDEPFLYNDDRALKMAEKRYVMKDKPSITLIPLMHMAEPQFFKSINDTLRNIDIVLYEYATDPDNFCEALRTEPMCKNLFTYFNKMAAGEYVLRDGLVSQHDYLDIFVTGSNEKFINADMTIKQIIDLLIPSIMKLTKTEMPDTAMGVCHGFTHLLNNSKKLQAELNYQGIVLNRKQFTQNLIYSNRTFRDQSGLWYNTVIYDRNEFIINKLGSYLNDPTKTIAIVYGAAHMADMEARLAKVYGYQPDVEKLHIALTY